MSNKYKLLVLGGGGFYGLIDITFLSYLGDDYDVCKNIDSISGCSIGGIEACALMAGNKAKDVQKAFIEQGDEIFKRRNKNILDIPWYSDEGLKKALQGFVGDKTIQYTKCLYPNTTMFIPTMNLTKNKMKVYDNIDGTDDDVKLMDVALQTSAAMFYFPTRNNNGDAVVDGGVRQVVPVMTHATGVKHKLGIDFQDMDVFVIGAGKNIANTYGTYDEIKDWKALDWATKFIVNDITASNECTSKFFGEHLGFNSFTWFNPVQIYGSMDDTDEKNYMLEECIMYKELFLDKWNDFLNK